MARPVFRFNGVDQYATHPDWTPNGLPFEVRAKAVPLSLPNASNYLLGTGTSQFLRAQQTLSRYNLLYEDVDGATQQNFAVENSAAPNSVANLVWSASAEGSNLIVNGAVGSNPAIPAAPFAAPYNAIASYNAVGFDRFHGPVYDIEYIDNSPIQDTDILEGNGARYIEIPAFVLAAGDEMEISGESIRQDVSGTSALRVLGDGDSGDDRLLFFDVSHPTLPNAIQLTFDNSTNCVWGNILEDIAQGQHFRWRITHTAADGWRPRLYLDGVDKGLASQNTGGGLVFTIEQLCSAGGSLPLPTGAALQNVTLENLTTGDYVRYAIDEGSGTVIKAYDRDGNVLPLYGADLVTNTATVEDQWQWDGASRKVICGGTATVDRVLIDLSDNVVAGRFYEIDIPNTLGGGQTFFVDFNATPQVGGLNNTDTKVVVEAGNSGLLLRIGRWTGAPLGEIGPIVCREIQHGTVTPDASWANVPENSRFYPANEQTGDTFKCYQKGVHVPALDATIQNFDNASWDILPPGGYGSGPGITTSDARFDYLRSQLYVGSTNEMLLKWLQDNGAGSSTTLPDAWKEMLASKGFTQESRIDAWFALLRGQGHTGTISDMELQFWEGGAVLPP